MGTIVLRKKGYDIYKNKAIKAKTPTALANKRHSRRVILKDSVLESTHTYITLKILHNYGFILAFWYAFVKWESEFLL